jgi:hypothetical protein
MSEKLKHDGKASPAQITYANMLFYGSWGGLAIMVITYLLYVSGLVAPHVPLKEIPLLWSQPVHTYLEVGQVPHGWGWLVLIGKGDFLNFVGIVLLAAMTLICYIPLIPSLLKRGEKVMAFMALAEIIVLALAASGLVSGGGH